MKTKYERMTKEEKKKLQEEYANSDRGKVMLPKLNRLIVTGFFCYFFVLYSVFASYYKNQNMAISDIVIAVSLFLGGSIFLFGSHKIRKQEYTKFAVRKK